MRRACILLVVAFILAYCCDSIVNADDTAVMRNVAMDSNHELTNDGEDKRYLQKPKTSVDDEERGVPGITNFDNVVDKIETEVIKSAESAKTTVREILKKERHASVTVAIDLLKLFAVVATIAVISGLIVYHVSNS